MSTLIPEGLEDLEPLAIWDANTPDWIRGPWRERAEWVDEHLGETRYIYRAEFYLIDVPFAVVGRFVPDHGGLKWISGDKPVTETVTVPLTDLPPAHLMGKP